MGLGVLDDYKLEHVPGTVFLNEAGGFNLELAVETGNHLAAGLKHQGSIVLVPQVTYMEHNANHLVLTLLQPSDSPNDPLNWSKWYFLELKLSKPTHRW